MSPEKRTDATRGDDGGGPLVSVVMPTYNYAQFVGEAIESLRAQTYPHWECVVVDDGSTDATAEVLARVTEREPRVRYVRQENRRQAAAKNNGLANSSGEYVQFLDADDLLEPRKFERQVEYLERHPAADIVYGGVRYFSTENPSERRRSMFGEDRSWMPEVSGAGAVVQRAVIAKNIMAINSPLLRRSVVEEVGPFDDALPPLEDWEFWIRCALAGKRFEFWDAEGTLALVRSHPASSSRQRPHLDAAWRRMRGKIDALLVNGELRRLNREEFAQFEAGVGVGEVEGGRRLSAARHFFKAGTLSTRLNSRGKWVLCALASPFASARQLRKLIAFSPSQTLRGRREGENVSP